MESLGFSISKIISSANSDNFTSSFSIWMLFTYFSCMIALVKTSSIMLNKSGESAYPCLVRDFRGIAFSFSPLGMMLAVGLSYMAFIMLRYIPSILTLLRVSIINGCWILSNAFSASMRWDHGFYPSLCYSDVSRWLICGSWSIPGINPTWSRLLYF